MDSLSPHLSPANHLPVTDAVRVQSDDPIGVDVAASPASGQSDVSFEAARLTHGYFGYFCLPGSGGIRLLYTWNLRYTVYLYVYSVH